MMLARHQKPFHINQPVEVAKENGTLIMSDLDVEENQMECSKEVYAKTEVATDTFDSNTELQTNKVTCDSMRHQHDDIAPFCKFVSVVKSQSLASSKNAI